MVIGAPRPPRATTVSPKLKWPYGGYHNGLEHNLEWSFSEVIGFFIQIIFKYLQKLETFFQKTFVFKLHICFCLSHLLALKKRDYRIVNFRWRIPDQRFFSRFVYCPSDPWYLFDILNLSVKSTFEGSSQIRKWVMPSLIDRNHIGVNHTLSLGISNLGNVSWFCLELDHFLNLLEFQTQFI